MKNSSLVRCVFALTLLGCWKVFAESEPQPQISIIPGAAGGWKAEWAGVAQRAYFVQWSTDLEHWSYEPVIRFGDGPQDCDLTTGSAPGYFVRIKYLDGVSYGSVEDARNGDLDSDGISNAFEVETSRSDPFDGSSVGHDTDGDHIPDWWETANGLDPNQPGDATGDPDRDGLTSSEEFLAHTKPNHYDTDGDQFPDGFEVRTAGYKPLAPDVDGDKDTDGLSDLEEMAYGTDPGRVDSDSDGISDREEINQGADPMDISRRPFDPASHFGSAITEASVQPIGNLGVANYGVNNSYKVDFTILDSLTMGPTGDYLTNQESWRLVIGDHMSLTPPPQPTFVPGGGYYPPYSIGAKLQLDGRKAYKVMLQHLGLAGISSTGGGTVPDYRHSWSISSADFLIVTNQSGDPVRFNTGARVSQTGPFPSAYNWTTRENYLIPVARAAYASSYSGGDATGTRFRRISHFGRPLPDEKPDEETESDTAGEESFVDAFDLSLHHDNSFVSIPVGASELRLEATMSSRESGWSDRSGLRPAEDLTSPFGIGWSSNLCAYIEVVETLGNSSTRPMTVNVVDEGGRSQRFGTSDMTAFFPWPSTFIDRKTYLNELRLSGTSLILTKKFGNKLTYRPCDSWFMYASDRLDMSDSVRKHRYWRLEEVEDRFGRKLIYNYGGSPYSLIPSEIGVEGLADQKIAVTRSADGRRVMSITDPENHVTSFHYQDKSVSIPSTTLQFPYQELDRVTFPDSANEDYSYEVVVDQETIGNRVTNHVHANLKTLKRGAGAERVFTYGFDRTKKWHDFSIGRIAIGADVSALPSDVRQRARDYVAAINMTPQSGAVLRTQYGVPRILSKIEWPSLGLESHFSKSAQTETVFGPQFQGVNATHVIDTGGKACTYTFGGSHGEIVDTDSTVSGGTSGVSTEWLIYYTTLKIDYEDGNGVVLGSENFEFDPASGLSLKRTVDFCGNETSWSFGESRPSGPRITLAVDPAVFSKWSDPLSKTDALQRREEYEYGPHRILTKSTDVNGTVTGFTVDALGRRTAMSVTDSSGNKLQEEAYAYDDARFPGFMTRKTRKAFNNLSGKSWEHDLVVEYVADNHGRLEREIVDPGGVDLETVHTYDSNNQKTSTLDPRGSLTTFVYDAMNRLEKVIHPDSTFKTIGYDDHSSKILEVDENGNTTFYQRDGLGRVVGTVRDLDGDGVIGSDDIVTRQTYDEIGMIRSVTDPRGFATVTVYDDLHRPQHIFHGVPQASADGSLNGLILLAAGSRSVSHDQLFYDTDSNCGGGLLNPFMATSTVHHEVVSTDPSLTDFTLTDTTEFDVVYRPVSSSREYAPAAENTTLTVYGAVNAAGKESLVVRTTDALGKVTRTTSDGLGRPLEVIDGLGLADPTMVNTTTTSYSSTGLAWRSVDPLGRHTETEYDGAGRPVKVWQPDPATGAITGGSPVTETSYDPNGNVVAVVDPLGRRSDFSYDSRNRRTMNRAPQVTDATNPDAPLAGVRPTTSFNYDGVGNVIATTDPRGSTIRTFYDRANRPVMTRSNPVTGNPSSADGVPGAGDLDSVTQLDKGGLALSITDANGNITRNAYDGLGRLVATVCDPSDGNPADLAASGFDPEAYRNSNPGCSLVSNIHDDAGNIIEVTDGNGGKTAFGHDGFGRTTATVWDPGTAAEQVQTAEFNALYQTRRTDGNGHVTLYLYDPRHRLRDLIYGPAPGGTTSTHVDNRHLEYDRVGKLLAVTYPNEANSLRSSSVSYDHLDRVTLEMSAGVTHLYPEYDLAGNRRKTVYGRTGTALVCSYDALNRLSTCEERSDLATSSGRITGYVYDPGGKVTRRTLPNGNSTTSTFDKLGRTLSIIERNAASAVVSSFDYSQPVGSWPSSHDAAGNVLRCAETYSRPGMVDRVVTSTYDHCNRLATETLTPATGATVQTTYGYDPANNRTTKTVGSLVTRYVFGDGSNGANSNQLKSYGPAGGPAIYTFTYDANGNRIGRSGVLGKDVYGWDSENRLVSFRAAEGGTDFQAGDESIASQAPDGGIYHYAYDHRDRRVFRDESAALGTATVISYSGGNSVQEATVAGGVQAELIRGSDWGGGVGGLLYSIRGGQRSYNAYNSRGDVVSTSDDTGAASWQAAYEAFGTRTAEQGVDSQRQRANTKEEDPTGLLNEGRRYRDLEAGVFISRDPAGFVDGPNVYAYVRQNPWTMFDPEGLFMKYFGDWAAETFGAPPAPVCFMAKHSGKVTGTVHAINGAVSFVPALGKVADGLDATISAAEGDYAGAALTAGGGKAAQLATKAVKVAAATVTVAKIASHADDAAKLLKVAEKSADEAVDLAKSARNVSKEASVVADADRAVNGAVDLGDDTTRVVGRTPDLEKAGVVRAGETPLDFHIVRNADGSTAKRATWYNNHRALRSAMREGRPIRDVSPGDIGGQFLNGERMQLEYRGWTRQIMDNDSWWIPPIHK